MMKTYLVLYEAFSPSAANLESKIRMFIYWARPFQNAWLVKSTMTNEQVLNELRSVATIYDQILVITVNNEWMSINLSPEVVQWMKGGL